jgi:hypothetical protein
MENDMAIYRKLYKHHNHHSYSFFLPRICSSKVHHARLWMSINPSWAHYGLPMKWTWAYFLGCFLTSTRTRTPNRSETVLIPEPRKLLFHVEIPRQRKVCDGNSFPEIIILVLNVWQTMDLSRSDFRIILIGPTCRSNLRGSFRPNWCELTSNSQHGII